MQSQKAKQFITSSSYEIPKPVDIWHNVRVQIEWKSNPGA